jgi:hypothetical protein
MKRSFRLARKSPGAQRKLRCLILRVELANSVPSINVSIVHLHRVGGMTNHAWVIAKPNRGGYNSTACVGEEREVSPLNEGEVLVRTLLLSLDPTSLNCLKLEPSYSSEQSAGSHGRGDHVSVDAYPARDGATVGFAKKVTRVSGRTF